MTCSSTPLLWMLTFLVLLLVCLQPSQQSSADRSKRQTFDFSINTPPPGSNSSANDGDSGAAGTPSGWDTGNTGGDLGSALGDLLGSSGPTDNSNTSTTDAGGGLGGGLGSIFGQPDPVDNTSTLSTDQGGMPNDEEGNAGGGLGGGLGSIFGQPDPVDNTSTLSTDQGGMSNDEGGNAGGGLGGGLGDLFGSSDPADNSSNSVGGTGGSDTSCGLNAFLCQAGYTCFNGGTCVYDAATCSVDCVCPPPYDDRMHYDKHCQALGSSPSTTSQSPSSPTSSGSTTTLRPLEERNCGTDSLAACQHGYCRINNVTNGRICVCDSGWRDSFCDVPCARNCSNDGLCIYDSTNDEEVCDCLYPWVGSNCTEMPPEVGSYLSSDTELVAWLAGSFAVGFVVLVALGVFFMFCLWRKRLVFAMRFVYYFKSYEDHDGKVYDAFVSYVSRREDENFVYSTLYPKLEQEMGFALCLHQRDFIIGDMISNNILNALDNSRRFILVLSPRYLQSAWAEFEYQRAFQEMLSLKMRIIPVILEDISQCASINPTLKAILQSVTYITYPGPEADERQMRKFWKRVQLSMPKRKNADASEMNVAPAGHDAATKIQPCPATAGKVPISAVARGGVAAEGGVVSGSVKDSAASAENTLQDSSAADNGSTAKSASTTFVTPNNSNGHATVASDTDRVPVTQLSDVVLETGPSRKPADVVTKDRNFNKGGNFFKTVFGLRKGKAETVRLEGFHPLGDFSLSTWCQNARREGVTNGDLSKEKLHDEIDNLESRLQRAGGLTSA